MMAPSRALRLICRAGVAVLLRGVSSVELVWQQIAAATPATPIQPTATHFVPPDEMLDVGDGKNACNQAPCPNQKSPQRSEVFHFAKCEMAADRPSPLLFRAIAKARAAPPRRARAARQLPGPRAAQRWSGLRPDAAAACSIARSHDWRTQSRRWQPFKSTSNFSAS